MVPLAFERAAREKLIPALYCHGDVVVWLPPLYFGLLARLLTRLQVYLADEGVEHLPRFRVPRSTESGTYYCEMMTGFCSLVSRGMSLNGVARLFFSSPAPSFSSCFP